MRCRVTAGRPPLPGLRLSTVNCPGDRTHRSCADPRIACGGWRRPWALDHRTRAVGALLESAPPRPDDAKERQLPTTLEVQPTLGLPRVLQRAVFHVKSSGNKEVGLADVPVIYSTCPLGAIRSGLTTTTCLGCNQS